MLLTTRSTKVSATRGSREAERSSNTQCGEDNTSATNLAASRTRSRKSSNNHNRHGFSNELKCDHPSRAPQNRKCQCELRLHHGEKGRLVIQTRSKSAHLHRCLLSTTALKGSCQLTESIDEKTNKCSLSEPLLLQASMLLSTLTLFLWGSWSTKFSEGSVSKTRNKCFPRLDVAAAGSSGTDDEREPERARRRLGLYPSAEVSRCAQRGG